MRGVSGSGKSTIAREIPGVIPKNIFSTDDLISDTLEGYNQFFNTMNKNQDWSPLDKKHKELIDLISIAMKEDRGPLVLDNMNLSAWECKEAVEMALENDYEVEFIDVGTGGQSVEELAKRNKHGVGFEGVQEMVDKYKQEGPLTIEKVLESEMPEENTE